MRFCARTRATAARCLSHFGIGTPARPYHEHNAAKERPRVLADLAAGQRIALISDAGTPLVSDPGWKLVREAIDAGHRVEALPGASATLSALAVAGLPTDAFLFAGFLPPKSAGRRTRIAELAGGAGDARVLRGAIAHRPKRSPISPPCSVRVRRRWRAS